MYIYTIHINKIYSSKYADQLSLWIWINKTNYEWCDKESYFCWIFIIGPDYFFNGNRYSWLSHANLARWWWRSSKISLRTVVDLAFSFACHVLILSWITTTLASHWILLCYFSNQKNLYTDDLSTISGTFNWFFKIENILM